MGDFDANPFADPFKDGSVTQATSETSKPSLEDFNPFGSGAGTSQADQPAVMKPSEPPPYSQHDPVSSSNVSAPPVYAPVKAPSIPGHEELLRRQEEIERKAEELQRREREMASSVSNPRANNWPPLPKCCPVGPCFYQDFSVDIPTPFQATIKMLYYLWMLYIVIILINVLACMAAFVVDSGNGVTFGMSILWFILFVPCSLCWYRPAYKAFRSDSSFNFFFFFFIMFFQICFGVLMTVGIPGAGWCGWIVALDVVGKNAGAGVFCCIQAALFSVFTVLSVILLKKVHSLYRTTGASFQKAQVEFSTDVMKNPGVQTAAANAAASAVQSNLTGQY